MDLNEIYGVVLADPRLASREKLSRRLTNCVILVMSERPDIQSEDVLIRRTRTKYREVYCNSGLLGYIVVHVMIGVIVHLIANRLLDWWEQRSDREGDVTKEQYTCKALGSLADQVYEQVAKDADSRTFLARRTVGEGDDTKNQT